MHENCPTLKQSFKGADRNQLSVSPGIRRVTDQWHLWQNYYSTTMHSMPTESDNDVCRRRCIHCSQRPGQSELRKQGRRRDDNMHKHVGKGSMKGNIKKRFFESQNIQPFRQIMKTFRRQVTKRRDAQKGMFILPHDLVAVCLIFDSRFGLSRLCLRRRKSLIPRLSSNLIMFWHSPFFPRKE